VAIILDADVIIRDERRTFDLKRWAASLPDEQFQIAAITVAELWHGVERANPAFRPDRQDYVRRTISLAHVLPYTENTAFAHARIWAEPESSGKMIGYYDLIVAATALEHGSKVATFNERHFAAVRGLKMLTPR
jgi:tRNA(fMet)-specific endonuclease VapC